MLLYYLEEFATLAGVGAVIALPIKLLTKKPWWWGIFLALFIAYCGIVVIEIVRPFERFGYEGMTTPLAINLIPFREGIDRDVIENIVCTLPFGFLLPLIIKRFTFIKALISGLAFGLGMELLQVAFYFIHGKNSFRVVDINDVICNTIGAVAGWTVFALVLLLVLWLIKKGVDNSLFRYIAERDKR